MIATNAPSPNLRTLQSCDFNFQFQSQFYGMSTGRYTLTWLYNREKIEERLVVRPGEYSEESEGGGL